MELAMVCNAVSSGTKWCATCQPRRRWKQGDSSSDLQRPAATPLHKGRHMNDYCCWDEPRPSSLWDEYRGRRPAPYVPGVAAPVCEVSDRKHGSAARRIGSGKARPCWWLSICQPQIGCWGLDVH